jgi:hypothetical protein
LEQGRDGAAARCVQGRQRGVGGTSRAVEGQLIALAPLDAGLGQDGGHIAGESAHGGDDAVVDDVHAARDGQADHGAIGQRLLGGGSEAVVGGQGDAGLTQDAQHGALVRAEDEGDAVDLQVGGTLGGTVEDAQAGAADHQGGQHQGAAPGQGGLPGATRQTTKRRQAGPAAAEDLVPLQFHRSHLPVGRAAPRGQTDLTGSALARHAPGGKCHLQIKTPRISGQINDLTGKIEPRHQA